MKEFEINKKIGINNNIVKVYNIFSCKLSNPNQYVTYIKMKLCERDLEYEIEYKKIIIICSQKMNKNKFSKPF